LLYGFTTISATSHAITIGSGGNGGGTTPNNGMNGGSGIVIVRYVI
jgi:hypothetical protein